MLSSIAHTRMTLETSASSQLMASEKAAASNASLAQASSWLFKADAHQRRRNGECVFDSSRLSATPPSLLPHPPAPAAHRRSWQPPIVFSSRAPHAIQLGGGFGLGR